MPCAAPVDRATPISIGRRASSAPITSSPRVEALVESDPERYGDDWERYNQEFHDALISNCRSRWLLLFHKAMYDHSQRYRMLSLKTKPFPRSQSAKEHRRILDAALARDADKAAELLAQHILKGAELMGAPGG